MLPLVETTSQRRYLQESRYKQDAHPVFEFGSSTYLEPPERHILRMVIAGLLRRIRASGEQRTPYGTLFVATKGIIRIEVQAKNTKRLYYGRRNVWRETNIE